MSLHGPEGEGTQSNPFRGSLPLTIEMEVPGHISVPVPAGDAPLLTETIDWRDGTKTEVPTLPCEYFPEYEPEPGLYTAPQTFSHTYTQPPDPSYASQYPPLFMKGYLFAPTVTICEAYGCLTLEAYYPYGPYVFFPSTSYNGSEEPSASGEEPAVPTPGSKGGGGALQGLSRARLVLVSRLKKMKAAVKELESHNEVFCMVSGQMLDRLELPRFLGKVYEASCKRIPAGISSALDAEKKIAKTEELIKRLDQEIAHLQSSAKGSATARPRPAVVAARSAAMAAAGMRDLAAPISLAPVHHRARGAAVDPLRVLVRARNRALGAIGSIEGAVRKGQLKMAARKAQHAASLFASLPKLRSQARRYLKRHGLGKIRFSRAQILAALKRLTANRLQPRMVAWARKLHLSTAEMQARIRAATAVPATSITGMNATSLSCSPVLDQLDKSISAALHKVAQTL